MIDLLLVNPNSRPTYGALSQFSALEPPLWCALLAAYVRQKGYSVRILDAEVENLSPEKAATRIAQENPLLVAIIAMGHNPAVSSTPKMTTIRQILEKLKEKTPHIKTIVGGLHPSALPLKTANELGTDVYQGEGFFTIIELLESLKDGGFPKPIVGLWAPAPEMRCLLPGLVDIDVLPTAAWDLLPMEKYRAHNWMCLHDLGHRSPYGVLWTSLGCPFSCSYCPVHALYGKPGIRFRSPEKVIEEVDFLVKNYSIRNFKIVDELFALKRQHVERICDLLIQRDYGLNIWAYGRVDTASKDMLRKMKQAGINWVAYGFESASETVRQGVSKKFSQEEMIRAIEMTRAARINIVANVMFGLPDDSLEAMQRTLEMAKEFNFEWLNAHITMPYPGSRLYEEAIRQGARLPERWADWGQYSKELMPLPTKYLSGREVLEFRDKAFAEYFDRPEYLKMIEAKFGIKARGHVEEMLKVRLVRS